VSSAAPEERLLPRWVPVVFVGLTVALIPWTVWLYLDLPDRVRANHWAAAWAGFDLALALALGLTGLNIWRRSAWTLVTASAAGTMLLVDAWFDTMTASPGWSLAVALVMAVGAEIPLAVLCFWIALNLERVLEQAQRHLRDRGFRLRGRRLVPPEVSEAASEAPRPSGSPRR